MQKQYSKEFKETLVESYHSEQFITQLSKEYDLYSKFNEIYVSKVDEM